jgi:PPM family protein phosphatase
MQEQPENNKPKRTRKARKKTEPVLAKEVIELKPPSPGDITRPLPPVPNGNGTTPLATTGMLTAPGATTLIPKRLACQQVEATFLSDLGMRRDNNEDSACAFLGMAPRPDGQKELFFGFLGVADGMGGHDRGEVASNIAVRKMFEGVMSQFYVPTIEGRQPGREGQTPIEVLQGLIEDANQAILQEAHQHRTSMGTTLTCAIVVGQTAFVGHVGDSRCYVTEKSSGRMRLVTRDHSVVQRLVDQGSLTIEEAAFNPHRSVLYMSLGQKGRIEPDVDIVPLNDVKYMLLCSDGLWDMVEDYQIEHILNVAPGPAEACAMLVEAANNAGGYDNVTVVIAKF